MNQSTAPSTTSSTTFNAKHFRLESFGGPVRIEPRTDNQQAVTVNLIGSEARRKAIGFSGDAKTMVLSDDKADEGDGSGNIVGGISAGGDINITTRDGNTTVRVGGGSNVGSLSVGGVNMSIIGGVVTVNGVRMDANGGKTDNGATSPSEDEPALSALVLVPKGASITIDHLCYDAEIGNVGGPLKAKVSGTRRLTVDRVSEVELECSGTSSVRINDVHGDVTVAGRGCSKVVIEGGYADTLMLNASGTTSMHFGGTATRANLSTSGCSVVNVERVTGKVTKARSGSSAINVRKHEQGE